MITAPSFVRATHVHCKRSVESGFFFKLGQTVLLFAAQGLAINVKYNFSSLGLEIKILCVRGVGRSQKKSQPQRLPGFYLQIA